MKNKTSWIILIILLGFITWRECNRPSGDYPYADTIRITKIIPGDSIPYAVEIEKPVPVPVYRDTGSIQWRNLPVDTNAILEDYFAKYYYSDTLMDDSSAYIQLMAHTWQNKLFYDSLLFQNRREKEINTTIINPLPPERLRVYLGAGTSFSQERLALTADLLFVVPKGYAIHSGYDFINREIQVKGFIPIKLFKRRDPY